MAMNSVRIAPKSRMFRSRENSHPEQYRFPVIPTLLGTLVVMNVASAVLSLIE
jgi:hypothetical protein